MKILLISPPFFAPTVMPYSLAYLKGKLKSLIKDEVECLDLNAIFHFNELNDYYNKEFGGNIFKSASTDEEFNMMVADGKLKVGDLFLNKKNNKFVVITEEMLK